MNDPRASKMSFYYAFKISSILLSAFYFQNRKEQNNILSVQKEEGSQ